MALTEERLGSHTPVERTLPTHPAPSLGRSWAITLGVAWVAFNVIAAVLEPAPADATLAWWEQIVLLVQVGSLGIVAAGLARRTRWAAGASLGSSALFTAGVFACPATGHHAFGLWWFGEFAAVLALVAISATAVVRSRRTA